MSLKNVYFLNESKLLSQKYLFLKFQQRRKKIPDANYHNLSNRDHVESIMKLYKELEEKYFSFNFVR